MATSNRDFVVKNGLRVATGVTFGDATTQTVAYDNTKLITIPSPSFPSNPVIGQLYLDSANGRTYIYYNSWLELQRVQ